MHQQILRRKGLVRQDSCPAGSHTSVLRARHCCARAARASKDTDMAQRTPQRVCGGSSGQLTGVKKHKVYQQTPGHSLLLFPSWFQTTSSGYPPQTSRANACVNHSTRGPSWEKKIHRAAAGEQAVKHQKNLFSLTAAI